MLKGMFSYPDPMVKASRAQFYTDYLPGFATGPLTASTLNTSCPVVSDNPCSLPLTVMKR